MTTRGLPLEVDDWLAERGSHVAVLRWAGEAPRRRLAAACEANAGAVLVLVEDDDAHAAAVEAGAPASVRWPASRRLFEATLTQLEQRAAGRIPGRERRRQKELEDTLEAQTLEAREAAAQLHAVIHHLGEGVVAVGRDGRIKLWNPAAETLLGPIEPLARQSVAFVHDQLAELVGGCLDTDSSQRGEVGSADGSAPPRTLAVEVTPVFIDTPLDTLRSLGAVILVRDVTLERQVDRMKTDFIATVSHELRTPLTSVLGFAKLARNKLGQRIAPALAEDDGAASRACAQIDRNLEIIVDEGKRLAALIDDVLDVSKMEAGRVDWQRTTVVPSALIERTVEVTRGLFEGTELVCRVDVEPNLPDVVGDERRLLQVLINLVSNAVKFTRRGHVRLRAQRGPSGVRFSVEDTGTGIPRAERTQIFDKFRQVASTLEDRPRGTGLGLTICKHIVEHHGGTIEVDASPGGGSIFRFELPCSPPSAGVD